MVAEHRKYIRDTKLKADKQQSKLGEKGIIKPSISWHAETKITVNFNTLVACPFCLYTAKLSAFLVTSKDGYQQGKAHCPDCNNNMMMKSLYNDWTAKEYAEWVFNYRRSGFWQKCPFATWKKRLHKMGWIHEFWIRYKDLKGSDISDSYFEHMEKQAQEYADAQHKEYEATL